MKRGAQMNNFDKAYHDLCKRVLEEGENKDDERVRYDFYIWSPNEI